MRNLPVLRTGQSNTSDGPAKQPLAIVGHTQALKKRLKKRIIRHSLLAANIAVVVITLLIVVGNSKGNSTSLSVLDTANEGKVSNPLDTISAADVAVNVAIATELPETGLLVNNADSVNAELTAAVTSREAVIKPQILSSQIKTKEDIVEYITVSGDTLSSLSTKFGVTSDSIRWSNNLTSSTLKAGLKLLIPPIDGIVYTVKAGDTAANLAQRYSVPKEQILNFNDAELTGLIPGERIVIPGGTLRGGSRGAAFYSGFAFGNTAIYGYNGYVPGYCTWYVANKRIQIGRPLPANLGNAYTWDDYAIRAGFRVDHVPEPGAAVVTVTNSNPGHVAYVEEVLYNPDGSLASVRVSEMNRRRRYEITERVFGPAEAVSYNYIH